jgi:hypothetical protein
MRVKVFGGVITVTTSGVAFNAGSSRFVHVASSYFADFARKAVGAALSDEHKGTFHCHILGIHWPHGQTLAICA